MASKEKLQKEKEQVKELLSKTESGYRTARISEKKYNETKARLLRKMEEIESKILVNGNNGERQMKKDSGEKESSEKKRKASKKLSSGKYEKPAAQEEKKPEILEKKKDSGEEGSKIMKEEKNQKSGDESATEAGKKAEASEEPKSEPKPEKSKKDDKKEEDNSAGDFTAEAAAQFGPQEEVSDVQPAAQQKEDLKLEIEKLKVLVDGMREEKKAVQESLQNISESMGELRSMIFQSEGLAKELEMKEDKIEEDISEIRPSEISKRLRKFDENFEKMQVYTDKSDAKFDDLSKKINAVYEMLKTAGSIENLAGINRQIAKKLEDFNEAMKYVERLATKTEKAFLEVNKNLDDFHVYKARQDNLEEAFKDMVKGIDEINVRMDEVATKKDFSSFSGEIMLIKKQMEEVQRLVPLLKVKIPEPIEKLAKEKEEVKALLEMLDGQQSVGTITKQEYDKLKKANENKLRKIEDSIDSEWKKLEKMLESGENTEETLSPEPGRAEPEQKPNENISAEPAAKNEEKTVEDDDASVRASENDGKNTAQPDKKTEEQIPSPAEDARKAEIPSPNPVTRVSAPDNSSRVPFSQDVKATQPTKPDSQAYADFKREMEEMIKSQMKLIEQRISGNNAESEPSGEKFVILPKTSEDEEHTAEEELEEEVKRVFREQSEEIPLLEEICQADEETEYDKKQEQIPVPEVKSAKQTKRPRNPRGEYSKKEEPEEKDSEEAKEEKNFHANKNQIAKVPVSNIKNSSSIQDEKKVGENIISRLFQNPHTEMKKEAEELKKIVTAKNGTGENMHPTGEVPDSKEPVKVTEKPDEKSQKKGISLKKIFHISEAGKKESMDSVSDVETMLDQMEKVSPEKTAIIERLKKAAESKPVENSGESHEEKQEEKKKAFEIARKLKEMM